MNIINKLEAEEKTISLYSVLFCLNQYLRYKYSDTVKATMALKNDDIGIEIGIYEDVWNVELDHQVKIEAEDFIDLISEKFDL